ncbi:MAG: T9SS type A sorting domain-containing protein, partial [Bacteroidia bacterium]|nr:T9SS type A sorting domain-containing protein [Bacteroidia bacterium]
TTLNLKKISLSLPFNGPQRISIFFRMGSMNGFENDSTQWQLISHSLVNGLGADEETPLDLSQLPELSTGKYALYIYNHDTSINCVNSTVIGNTFNFDHVMTIFDGIGRNKSNNAFQATLKGVMNLAGRISYVIKNSKDYAYHFSTSSSSDIHAQVASGNQQVIVTDALGCTAVKSFSVAPASPIPVHLTSMRHPRCSYSNDGEIGIHATAAQHEYYTATTIPFANPANGSALHIRNSSDIILNGIDFYLNKPGQAALYVKQGDFNGTLNNASAWTFLGNYNLSPGASAGISTLTIGTPLSLAMGEWSLYVYSADDIFRQLDSNAFAGDAYIGYRNSTVRTGSAGAFNNSQKSGSFWAGTLRYSLAQHQLSYLWNNNVAGNTLPNLGGGNYMVTITQDNTCQVQRHYQLIAPDPIQLHPSINQETDYDSNGSVLLNISGGMAPYFVQWVSSAQNGNQLAQLAAGSYPVFVSDFKGCILYDTIEVGRLISPVSSEGQLHLAPNPGQGQFYVAEEVNGMENCRMSIFDETGRLVRDEFTSISSLMSGGLDLRHYADGYYLIRVSDQDQVYHARLIITR